MLMSTSLSSDGGNFPLNSKAFLKNISASVTFPLARETTPMSVRLLALSGWFSGSRLFRIFFAFLQADSLSAY